MTFTSCYEDKKEKVFKFSINWEKSLYKFWLIAQNYFADSSQDENPELNPRVVLFPVYQWLHPLLQRNFALFCPLPLHAIWKAKHFET